MIKKAYENFVIDLKLIWNVYRFNILNSNYIYLHIFLFVLIMILLQWLFSLETLREIFFTNNNLSILDKIDVLFQAFLDIFRLVNDLTPISFILIALFQSISICYLIKLYFEHKVKNKQNKIVASSALGLLGAGCVTCSGSLLSPLLGLFAANVSTAFAERISDTLLIIAVVLSYIALSKITIIMATEKLKKNEKNI